MKSPSRSLWLGLFATCLVPVVAVAQGSRPPAKPPAKPPVSQAAKRLPDLKTPADKLEFLEIIRAQFTSSRVSTSAVFRPSDLDGELERQVSRESSLGFAPLVNDETFARRASIDLIGRNPNAEELQAFLSDPANIRRARFIDRLLTTEEFSRKWARYWRSVVFYESAAARNTVNPQAFEDWLFEEFQKGAPWDRIVAEMISASPKRDPKKKPEENGWEQDHGPNNFVLACERKPEILAAQTARLFMGISIGCAECHDHPFDNWKREQFHELAAFFAPGKYQMTDQYDPSKKVEVKAKFLLGETPPLGLKPDQQRVAVAAYLIYNPSNYWFARAYVNRIWNELVGDGFYSVDSLGPDKEVVHKLLVNRLGSTFRSNKFDIRWLFRVIMNSRAYQREIRTVTDTADLFTAVRPSRLRPYEVSVNVRQLIGENDALAKSINSTFDVNPSLPQADLEGSIQQALLMMNNGTLLSGLSKSALRKDLVAERDNREMIRLAFLGVLARTPSENEIERYLKLVQQSANRNEAIDDLLWILVNSSEFLTKR